MKKIFVITFMVVLVGALILSGCAQSAQPSTSAPATSSAPKTSAPASSSTSPTSAPASSSASAPQFKLIALYQGSPTASFVKNRWGPYLDALEKASNGQIKFDRQYGLTLLPNTKLYDGTAQGIVDLNYVPTAFTPGRFKRSEMVANSGLSNNRENAILMLNDPILKPIIAKDFANDKIHLGILDYSGPRKLYTTKKAVRTINDFKGLRIRGDGEWTQTLLSDVGATMISIAPTDRYDALEKGLCDGSCEVPTSMDPWGYQELMKYYTDFNVGAITTLIIWNKDTWNKMGPDLQNAITNTDEQLMKTLFAKSSNQEDDQELQSWVKQYGLELITPSEADQATMLKYSVDIWKSYADKLDKQGLGGTELLNAVIQARAKYNQKPW